MQTWVDEFSGSIAKVTTTKGDIPGGTATGFFYERDEKYYFVTNWHVMTGRAPDNPTQSTDGRFVTQVAVSFLAADQAGKIVVLTNDVPVNDMEGRGINWLQHPQGPQIDVAVMEFAFPKGLTPWILTNAKFFDRFVCCAGDSIYVLGYPWGIAGAANQLPIWKSGIIATVPGLDQNGLPRFLIDARTFRGMSGGPVICIEQISFSGNRVRDFQKGKDPIAGKLAYFCGVYSGRLYAPANDCEEKPVETDLGYVWRREVIDQIIDARQLGSVTGKR